MQHPALDAQDRWLCIARSESQARLTFDLKDVPEFTASLLCWELPLGMSPWLPVPRKCVGGDLFEARMQRLGRHSKTLLGPTAHPAEQVPDTLSSVHVYISDARTREVEACQTIQQLPNHAANVPQHGSGLCTDCV